MGDYFCPIMNGECPGTRCVLWGDILDEICDLTIAYKSIPVISLMLERLVKGVDNLHEELEDLGKGLNHIRSAIVDSIEL